MNSQTDIPNALNSRRPVATLLLAVCLMCASSVAAQTVTFEPSKDNTLYEDPSGLTSNGQGSYLFTGRTANSAIRRGLIAFDLSSIPSNSTITAVTLTLFSSRTGGAAAGNVSLRKVLRDWGEGASNASGEEGGGTTAQSGDATWLFNFFNTSTWSTPGGDFSGSASATTAVGATLRAYSWSGSGMVADVQSWVANPSGNFGWAIVGNETTDETANRFNSGENSSNPPRLTVSYTVPGGAQPPQLLNISTRLRVETGDNALIGGFIVTGNEPKRVIVRAIGPSLTQRGVPDALADPTLELVPASGDPIFNDNWKDSQQAEIEATTIPPGHDAESAIVRTLAPGAYTAVVRGKNNTTGVGLVEAYDLNREADSRLANISTRGLVQTGNNVMIGGFIVGGESNARVVARALGPSLAQRGVTNPLADPTLQLVDSNGNPLESNDNWRNDPDQAEIAAAGLAPENDLESALLANLPAANANYTAIVAGNNSGTGVGLVEVYHLR